MATMNVQVDVLLSGTIHLYAGTIDMDSSYAAGGEALDPAGVQSIPWLVAGPKGGIVFEWDAANQKLLARTSNGAAPAALADFTNGGSLATSTGIPFVALAQS